MLSEQELESYINEVQTNSTLRREMEENFGPYFKWEEEYKKGGNSLALQALFSDMQNIISLEKHIETINKVEVAIKDIGERGTRAFKAIQKSYDNADFVFVSEREETNKLAKEFQEDLKNLLADIADFRKKADQLYVKKNEIQEDTKNILELASKSSNDKMVNPNDAIMTAAVLNKVDQASNNERAEVNPRMKLNLTITMMTQAGLKVTPGLVSTGTRLQKPLAVLTIKIENHNKESADLIKKGDKITDKGVAFLNKYEKIIDRQDSLEKTQLENLGRVVEQTKQDVQKNILTPDEGFNNLQEWIFLNTDRRKIEDHVKTFEKPFQQSTSNIPTLKPGSGKKNKKVEEEAEQEERSSFTMTNVRS